MRTQNSRTYLIFVSLIIITKCLAGCGEANENPLEPDSPDYQFEFTSIAIQNDIIWFGSSGGGLVTFDGIKWSKYTKADGLPDNNIEAVVSQGDNIWFTISGSGQKIFKLNNSIKTKDYPVPSIVSLSADENSIWIGTTNEIGAYDTGRDSLVWYQLPDGGQLIALRWDGIGVWTAIQQTDDKKQKVEISKFDAQTGKWRSDGYFSLVNGEKLLAIALDGNILWYVTSRGDVRHFGITEKAALLTQVGILIPGSQETSGCIAADESFVWFGYGNHGLIRYDKILSKRESYFDGEIVRGIAVTAESVWAVTNAGAHRYDKKTGAWTHYQYPAHLISDSLKQ